MSEAMVFTGAGVQVFRLVAAKHAVLAEQRGRVLFGPRHPQPWTRAMRREFGLKPRATAHTIVSAIEARLVFLAPQAQAEGGIK